ncbi:MAG: GDP-mannose 4,6-dehydratase [Eubacteriales bacterium]|nr:GDP-mannose 4,6-dehydratase [Eubacteriales bacterium]
MKKVLIFGIAGFVGRYLTQEFLENGYSVSGSDQAEQSELPADVSVYRTDLLDMPRVEELISAVSPDIIVNLAAVSSVGASWSMPQKTISVNVIGSLNILEATKKCSNKPRVLFIGSSEEYETSEGAIQEDMPLNANNPYGISKVAQERFAAIYRERYGMPIYYVRAFNHTGIGQSDSFVLPSFCKQAAEIDRSGKPGVIKVGNLSVERDFSNVKDIVRAYRMIVESEDCKKVYNVGSGKAYRLSDLLVFITSLSGQPITIETDPARYRPADTQMICCDYQLIRKQLGWEPEYDIFSTLQEMYAYYRNK